MKKTRSILMVVLMLVVALSLSGCTLFGNKDKIEKEDNAQAAARGVIAVINEDKDINTLKGYTDSTFKIYVILNGGVGITYNCEIEKMSKIEDYFNSLRRYFSHDLLTGKMNLKINDNKIDVVVGSGASSNDVTAFCSYNVEINGKSITYGEIKFKMESGNQNNVVITEIEIAINVFGD